MKLNAVFSLLLCFLLCVFSISNAAINIEDFSKISHGVDPQDVSPEIIQKFKEFNAATDEVLRQLISLPRGDRPFLFGDMLVAFVYQEVYLRLAERGELGIFAVFDLIDEVLGNMIHVLGKHDLSPPKNENPHGQLPQTINFSMDIRLVLRQRAQWMLHQITNSLVSYEVKSWAKLGFELEKLVMEKLKPPPTHYGQVICKEREALLNTTSEIVAYNVEADKNDDYDHWKRSLDFVMAKHFDTLRQIYYDGVFPTTTDSSLLMCMAKLGITFERPDCNTQLSFMTRETIFKKLARNKEITTFLDYMRQRKSAASIPHVDYKPFQYLKPSILGIGTLFDLARGIEALVEMYWDEHTEEETRKGLAQFGLGLQFIQDTLLVGQETIQSSLNRFRPFEIPTDPVMNTMFKILPTANAILFNVIKPYISAGNLESLRKVLFEKRNAKEVEPITYGRLEAIYSIVEAELAMLFKMDDEKALLIYNFLELCRGIVSLGVKVHYLSYPTKGKDGKPIPEKDLKLLLGYNDTLSIFEDCLDFSDICLSKFSLKDNEYECIRTFSREIFMHMSELFATKGLPKVHKLQTVFEKEFLIFMDKRIKENSKQSLYRPLRGLIRPDMLKEKPKPVEPKENPAPKKKKQVVTKKKQKKTNKPKPVVHREENVKPPSPDLSEPVVEEKEFLEISNLSPESAVDHGVEKSSPSKVEKIMDRAIDIVASQPRKVLNSLTKPIKAIKAATDSVKTIDVLKTIKPSSIPLKNVKASSSPVKLIDNRNQSKSNFDPQVNWVSILQAQTPRWLDESLQHQVKPAKPKAITNRVIEKYEEPSHYAAIAESLGFVAEKVDPRDYLMALIFIGERVKKNRIEPLLVAFQKKRSTNYLHELFYKSIDSFEKEVRMLNKLDSDFLKPALESAGFASANDLSTCLKYIKSRNSVCHPYVPKSANSRKNIIARHLTTLDVLQSYDPTFLLRIRHHLEVYDEIFVRGIETETGRPRDLYSPQHTEKYLALIGLMEIWDFADLRLARNTAAHNQASDSRYAAYIDYVFGASPDHDFLKKL